MLRRTVAISLHQSLSLADAITKRRCDFVFVCGPTALAPLYTVEIVIAVIVARNKTSTYGIYQLSTELPAICHMFDDGQFDCVESMYPPFRDAPPLIVYTFSLDPGYPNSASAEVTISNSLAGDEGRASAEVSPGVLDMLGRRVAELVHEQKFTGSYEVRRDVSHLSSGPTQSSSSHMACAFSAD